MKWHWQYLAGFLLLVANVDVCIPFLKLLKISWLTIFFITWPIAILELSMWWVFWRWFEGVAFPEIKAAAKNKITSDEAMRNGVDLWHELRNHLEEVWYMLKELIINHFLKIYTTAADKENQTVKRIKRWGHFFILLLGAAPIPTTRTLIAVICSITKWRSGFAALLIGDILHIAGVIVGWKILFNVAGKIT